MIESSCSASVSPQTRNDGLVAPKLVPGVTLGASIMTPADHFRGFILGLLLVVRGGLGMRLLIDC